MKYAKQIAVVDQEQRLKALKTILRNKRIDFHRQVSLQGQHEVENIVVSCNPSSSRLVIGAHYDSVAGSTGANDNAAACSVLIRLIKAMKDTTRSIDFVFFDREEYEDHGSTAYLRVVGSENVAAMINLDMCGRGDRIVISDKSNERNPAFLNLFCDDVMKKHNVETVGYLPNGDDDRFADAGIPNISVCTLKEADIPFFRRMAEKQKANEPFTEADNAEMQKLDVVSTMHNGKNDNADAISEEAMDMLFGYLVEGIG